MNRKALLGEFRKVVGLYLWGDVWEDYHGTLGISFQEFCTDYTGSWVFGLVQALQEIDVSAVMYFSTNTVKEVKRARHQPSGANICMIPAPRIYRTIYNK